MASTDGLFAAMTTFLVVNFLALGLRMYVRAFINKGFGYDDIMLCLGYLVYGVLCAMTIASIQFGYGATDARPQYDPVKATQFFFASLLAYLLAAWAVKTSVALVLYRLSSFDMRAIRRILETSMTIFTLLTVVAVFMVAFQCRPLSVIWGVGEGTCLPAESLSRIGLVFGAIDIVTNFLYSFLPIAMLWGLQLGFRTKVGVCFLLSLGILSSIGTCVRLTYIIKFNNLDAEDPASTQAYLDSYIWSHIELAIAIFAACLAALRPLARAAAAGVASAKSGSKGSSKQYYPVDGNPQPPAVELRDRDRDARSQPRFHTHTASQERIVKQTEINIDFAPAAKTPSIAEGSNSEYRA
ncbi:hypothetical protein PG985_001633 [Apiospora marii]|uniref:uncharacterized protein n=1 Tax=Apiospora marii TaxID=335849 RepID=UPI00312F9DA2